MNKNEIDKKIKPFDKQSQPLTNNYILHFDGCSKGNPGKAGIGVVIYNHKTEIKAYHQFIGDNKTNNESEYFALLLGLQKAIELNIKHIHVKGDSLLVISQLNGKYKVNSPKLISLYEQAMILKMQFTEIEFSHVYRDDNRRADELSNIALQKKDMKIYEM